MAAESQFTESSYKVIQGVSTETSHTWYDVLPAEEAERKAQPSSPENC
jgi:hypothetical protein